MREVPDHRQWRVGMTVDIGTKRKLRIVAVLHLKHCSTFALVSAKGKTFRYAPPLSVLYPTN